MNNFIKKWCASLFPDKQMHFYFGIGCGVAALILFENALIILLTIQVIGYGIEFVQSFIEGRNVESLDAYATVAGGVLGLTAALIWASFL